jgi:hypothetical protein
MGGDEGHEGQEGNTCGLVGRDDSAQWATPCNQEAKQTSHQIFLRTSTSGDLTAGTDANAEIIPHTSHVSHISHTSSTRLTFRLFPTICFNTRYSSPFEMNPSRSMS